MAVSGSGTVAQGKGIDPAMEDRVTSTPINPRSGAAKRAQTSFDTKWGMKDRIAAEALRPNSQIQGAGGGYAGVPDGGGDIAGKNPLDPYPQGKLLVKQPKTLVAKWGMTGAKEAGASLDSDLSGKVLGEAILSGSTRLPAAPSEITDSGKAPKPWPASDPN